MSNANYSLIDLQFKQDDRGVLVVAQAFQHIPFKIERFFSITGVGKNKARGAHAHKTLSQFLICINGSVNVVLDNGIQRENVIISNAKKGLLIPPMIWAEQIYAGPDTVLVVLCDAEYDENDYISEYQEFISTV